MLTIPKWVSRRAALDICLPYMSLLTIRALPSRMRTHFGCCPTYVVLVRESSSLLYFVAAVERKTGGLSMLRIFFVKAVVPSYFPLLD